tara:strand:+ start:7064 stop:8722 length:1659 start_codon:yes stop_codon:yes gene_type:complete
VSKLSDQIRQEYREAVASAIEGKDDIEAWGKVYQSLAQSIFFAWLSSVAKNTEGIEECEVAKLIFAKPSCGAGTEGNAGFQPGNTCAGEGGGEDIFTDAIKKHDYKSVKDSKVRYRLSKQLRDLIVDDKNKGLITKNVESGTIINLHDTLQDLENYNLKNLESFYGKHHNPDGKRIFKEGSKSDLASVEFYEYVKSYVTMSEEEQLENQNKLVKKADDFVCSVYLDAINIAHDTLKDSDTFVDDYEYINKDGEKTGITMTSKTKVFKDVEEYIDDRFTLKNADEAEIRVLTESIEELDGTVASNIKGEKYEQDTKKFLNALSDVKKILKEKNIQIPNLEIHFSMLPFWKDATTQKHQSVGIFTQPGRELDEFKSQLSFDLKNKIWSNPSLIRKENNFVASKLPEEKALQSLILHEIGHQLNHVNLYLKKIKKRHKTPDSVKVLLKNHKEGQQTRGVLSGSELMGLSIQFLETLNDLNMQYEKKAWDIARFEEGLDIKSAPDWFAHVKKNISDYASTRYSEFVAETFAGLALGLEYDNLIMKMYQNLGGAKVG